MLRRAVAKLSGGGVERPIEQVAEMQARVAKAALSNAFQELSRRDLREGCRAFLHPPNPPGRNLQVGARLIGEVARLQRRAAFLALIDVYLDSFAPRDEAIADLGRHIGKLMPNWPWRPTDRWRDRARAFALFDPARAPDQLAQAVLSSQSSPRLVLADAGLDTEGRRRGGLAESSFLLACRSVARLSGPTSVPQQVKLVEWAEGETQVFAYPSAWPSFAEALFVPWTQGEPQAAHKRLLVDTALACAGDPRIRETRWRPVREANAAAYDAIVRWLTKASVEQFFDIVSETMTDRPDMWAERRRFWTRYLNTNLISAAWVVFGSDGARRAEQAARRSTDQSLSMFGRLASGGGRTSEHAALIMAIGDLTVVEWSHNGKWNIWHRAHQGRPKQGRSDYTPQELMGAPLNGSHHGSWQWKLADIITRHTGLRP